MWTVLFWAVLFLGCGDGICRPRPKDVGDVLTRLLGGYQVQGPKAYVSFVSGAIRELAVIDGEIIIHVG